MTRAVAFRRAARHEFDAAALWYEAQRPDLGIQFVSEINHAVLLATESAERFPVMHRDIRCIRVRRFPYSVFFRVEPERIVGSGGVSRPSRTARVATTPLAADKKHAPA